MCTWRVWARCGWTACNWAFQRTPTTRRRICARGLSGRADDDGSAWRQQHLGDNQDMDRRVGRKRQLEQHGQLERRGRAGFDLRHAQYRHRIIQHRHRQHWGLASTPVVIDSAGQNIGGINFDTAAGSYFIGSTGGNSLLPAGGGPFRSSAR